MDLELVFAGAKVILDESRDQLDPERVDVPFGDAALGLVDLELRNFLADISHNFVVENKMLKLPAVLLVIFVDCPIKQVIHNEVVVAGTLMVKLAFV